MNATATITRDAVAAAAAMIPYIPALNGSAAWGARIDVRTADGEVELESLAGYDELVASGAEITRVVVFMGWLSAERADNDELLAEMGGANGYKFVALAEASDFWPEAVFTA